MESYSSDLGADGKQISVNLNAELGIIGEGTCAEINNPANINLKIEINYIKLGAASDAYSLNL
jgi:hypothetical protein